MKTTNLNRPGEFAHSVTRGHISGARAGSSGIDLLQGTTTVDSVTTVDLRGVLLTGDEGSAVVAVEAGNAVLTVMTPAQLTANTDNWAPTSGALVLAAVSIIRASTDASRNLTGIAAPTAERSLILENVGAFDLVLKHDVTSTAANRFYCPNDVDLTLQKDSAVIMEYDATSTRWRVLDRAVDLATLAPTTFTFPGATSPAQTAEGSAVWDTDDDKLTVGTGAARKTMVNEGAVTTSGLTQATGKMLGRSTAATGAIEEITVGTGLTLSGGSLTASGGGSGNVTAPSAVSVDLGATSLLTRRAATNTEDDLFDAASLNAKWLAYTNLDATLSLTALPGWAKWTALGVKLQAVPAGDWTVEGEFLMEDIDAATFAHVGLILTNGTTATSATDARWYFGERNSLQDYGWVFEKFVNNAFSSTYSSRSSLDVRSPLWLQVVKSGTTYTVLYRTQAWAGWQRFFQTSALGFTPTHFGIVSNGTGAFCNGFYRY